MFLKMNNVVLVCACKTTMVELANRGCTKKELVGGVVAFILLLVVVVEI
jgi:hypothetical protein